MANLFDQDNFANFNIRTAGGLQNLTGKFEFPQLDLSKLPSQASNLMLNSDALSILNPLPLINLNTLPYRLNLLYYTSNPLLYHIFIKYYNLVLVNCNNTTKWDSVTKFNNHISKFFCDYDLNNLYNDDILNFRSYLSNFSFSLKSILDYLSLFKTILIKGIKWNMITGKLPEFDMPKFDNKRVRFLNKKEACLLLNYLAERDYYWYDMSLISLSTGMRLSEIYNLLPSNISLEHGLIYVVDTKTNKNRAIPMSPVLHDIFEEKLKTCTGYLYPRRSTRVYRTAVEKCGLNNGIKDARFKVCFHTLRHTFASWLVQGGTPLFSLSMLLGHSDTKMTARYSHLKSEFCDKDIKIVSDILSDLTP
jgi:integrase